MSVCVRGGLRGTGVVRLHEKECLWDRLALVEWGYRQAGSQWNHRLELQGRLVHAVIKANVNSWHCSQEAIHTNTSVFQLIQ